MAARKPLDPVRFGAEVIDRFGSYMLTTFPIADRELDAQVREEVYRAGTRGRSRVAGGPFVYLNQPFEPGPRLRELVEDSELGLHPTLPGIFSLERLHRHQELALRSLWAGKHTVVATGTGSGKTEAFLLPVVDYCLRLRELERGRGARCRRRVPDERLGRRPAPAATRRACS